MEIDGLVYLLKGPMNKHSRLKSHQGTTSARTRYVPIRGYLLYLSTTAHLCIP